MRSRLLLLTFAAIRSGVALALGFHPFDDTFITFRYARNLALGYGFVFNHGERVLGTTTPLWTLVLAACRAAGVPIPAAALALALLADVVSAFLLLRMLLRLGFPTRVALGAAMLFLILFDYLTIARSGMETSLFVVLVLLALSSAVGERPAVAWFAAGLACLARPEGLALLPVLLLAGLARWREREARRGTFLGLAVFAVVLGAWALFASRYFGSFVPQSIVAKASHVAHDPGLARFSWMNLALFLAVGQYGGGIFERTWLQLNVLLTALSAVAVFRLGLDAVRNREVLALPRLAALAVFPLGFTAGLAASHAFTWFPWYYGPIYPFAALLATVGLDELAGVIGRRRLVPAGVALLAAAQIAAALAVKLPRDRDFMVAGYLESAAAIPRRPDSLVAALEIGAVGWQVWPLPVLDLLGLVSPEAIGRAPEEMLRSARPHYLCLRTADAAPLLERVARADWFTASYGLHASVPDPSGGRVFVVYRRRGSPRPSGTPHRHTPGPCWPAEPPGPRRGGGGSGSPRAGIPSAPAAPAGRSSSAASRRPRRRTTGRRTRRARRSSARSPPRVPRARG
ncbi:MAG TPA: hypothetical protein VE685_20325 [Thermoanaerobaculia bacterium]|nr:hypothetical protein [Thermoanaerobaculia bacterium]